MVLRKKAQIKFLPYLDGGGHDRILHPGPLQFMATDQSVGTRTGRGGSAFVPQNLLVPGPNPRSTVLRPKMWQLLETFTSIQSLEVCN